MYVLQTSLILWVVLPQYVVYNLPGSHRVDRRNPKYYYVERDYSREREERGTLRCISPRPLCLALLPYIGKTVGTLSRDWDRETERSRTKEIETHLVP